MWQKKAEEYNSMIDKIEQTDGYQASAEFSDKEYSIDLHETSTSAQLEGANFTNQDAGLNQIDCYTDSDVCWNIAPVNGGHPYIEIDDLVQPYARVSKNCVNHASNYYHAISGRCMECLSGSCGRAGASPQVHASDADGNYISSDDELDQTARQPSDAGPISSIISHRCSMPTVSTKYVTVDRNHYQEQGGMELSDSKGETSSRQKFYIVKPDNKKGSLPVISCASLKHRRKTVWEVMRDTNVTVRVKELVYTDDKVKPTQVTIIRTLIVTFNISCTLLGVF